MSKPRSSLFREPHYITSGQVARTIGIGLLLLLLALSLFLSLELRSASAGSFEFEDGDGYNPLNQETIINPAYAAFDDNWWTWVWDNNVAAGKDCSGGNQIQPEPVPPYAVIGCFTANIVSFATNPISVTGVFTIAPSILPNPTATNISMKISSSGPTTVTIYSQNNELLDRQVIAANTGSNTVTGTLTTVSLTGLNIARVVVNGEPTIGCGIGTTACIVVDDLQVNTNQIDPPTKVTRADAPGPYYGTLPYALTKATNGQFIHFALPNGTNNTVIVRSPLPVPASGVTIDGGNCTANGPVVTIDGSNAGNGTNGLILNGKVTLKAIKIARFKGQQVVVHQGDNKFSCFIASKT